MKPHQSNGIDLRDRNPHFTGGEKAPAFAYRDHFNRQQFANLGAVGDGSLQTWKYIRPIGVGRHELQHPTNPDRTTIIGSTNPLFTARKDQYVLVGVTEGGAVVIGDPPPNQKKKSNFPEDFTAQEGLQPVIENIFREPDGGA